MAQGGFIAGLGVSTPGVALYGFVWPRGVLCWGLCIACGVRVVVDGRWLWLWSGWGVVWIGFTSFYRVVFD